MKHLVAFLIVISSTSLCFAQQVKVIKVKGQQAIVEFPDDVKPKVGQTLEVGGGSSDHVAVAEYEPSVLAGSRAYTVGISAAQFSYLNNSVTNKNTMALQIEGRFGWNFGQFEVGPVAQLGYSSTDSNLSQYTLGGGGFIDVNLVPNKPGTELVYGLGGDAVIAMSSQKTYNKETNWSDYYVSGGGFVKWFIPKTTVAFRGDLDFYYHRYAPSSSNTDYMGPVLKAGVQAYF